MPSPRNHKEIKQFWVWPVIIENFYQDLLTFHELLLPLQRRTSHKRMDMNVSGLI